MKLLNTAVIFSGLVFALFGTGCHKEDSTTNPKLIIKIDLDSTQARLDNFGRLSSSSAAHASQSPFFQEVRAHYLELSPSETTLLGSGEVLYHAPETNKGGVKAIDFNQSIAVKPGGIWLEIPIKDIEPGAYSWTRLSLSYQQYSVDFYYNNIRLNGTLSSFIGFNQYIEKFNLSGETITVNENKLQGYWAFKSTYRTVTGQVPEGGITVPNPLFNSSPIPLGSCVVTGRFNEPFTLTGKETEDIELTLMLSNNNSFEWLDLNKNRRWDIGPNTMEQVVDMGIRCLIPSVNR